MEKRESSFLEIYRENCEALKNNKRDNEIDTHINFLFILSQSYPVENVSEFFNHSNFALTEAYEELKSSFELTKLGFYKQGLTSLRSVFELGILSTYWSIIGNEDKTFKEWIKAREKTPFSKDIKKKLLSNNNINKFNSKYSIDDIFNNLEGLHNYVHTKGINHSMTGQKFKKNEDLLTNWILHLKIVIQTITIYHLLRFPIATVNYDFLKKFGSYYKTPFCGGLFGDYQDYLVNLIGEEKYKEIKKIANEDDDLAEIINWLDSHPDLTIEQQQKNFIEEQTEWIKQSGFAKWYNSTLSVGVDAIILTQLKTWAKENNYLEHGEHYLLMQKLNRNT